MASIEEMFELVEALRRLGQELPQYLFFLSSLAEPNLTQDAHVTVLGKMFEEVPNMLCNINSLEFHNLITNLPEEYVTLRMLVNIHNIASIFQQMTELQILHLTNVRHPGPLRTHLDMLSAAQSHLRGLSVDTLAHLHGEMSMVSLQLERNRLLELQPRLPCDLLQLFMEILKLPLSELKDFYHWFSVLSADRLSTLAHLLQLDPIGILEFKNRLSLPSSNINKPSHHTFPPPPLPPHQQQHSPLPIHSMESPPTHSVESPGMDINSFMMESDITSFDPASVNILSPFFVSLFVYLFIYLFIYFFVYFRFAFMHPPVKAFYFFVSSGASSSLFFLALFVLPLIILHKIVYKSKYLLVFPFCVFPFDHHS